MSSESAAGCELTRGKDRALTVRLGMSSVGLRVIPGGSKRDSGEANRESLFVRSYLHGGQY